MKVQISRIKEKIESVPKEQLEDVVQSITMHGLLQWRQHVSSEFFHREVPRKRRINVVAALHIDRAVVGCLNSVNSSQFE